MKAIINVEGNFFPNVDYASAFARGVRVLGCGTAYSQAVAEYSLALALDAARGISREDRNTRTGSNAIVSATTTDSILLRRANVGLIGYGNLGRSLHALLAPFHNRVRVYDPWLPASVIEDTGAVPSSLEDTLTQSTFVFVFATATAESRHLLDGGKLDLLPDGARLILVSRAAVVDYDALLERLRRTDSTLPSTCGRSNRFLPTVSFSRCQTSSSPPTAPAASPKPSTPSATWSATTSS